LVEDPHLITLSEPATGSSAIISPVGASLMSLTLAGNKVIEQVAAGRPELYAGVVMAPWSGRIADGKWIDAEGAERSLEVNELARNNALHGLVFDKVFEVKKATTSSVELSIVIAPTDGYPHRLRLAVAYELEDGELFASFAVRNSSETDAPFSIGFHPYISTAWSDSLLELQSTAQGVLELNENMIATGKDSVSTAGKDLRSGKALSDVKLDDDFTDLNFSNGIASTKLLTQDGSGCEIWQEDIFKHTVIYTPENFPTESGSIQAIAIEPSTSAVNAFNTKQDLLVLSPGETRSGSWGIRLVN
jgi:aldose 1-epimerase